MKQISIKNQKRILFIPYINVAILFIWVFINSRYIDGWVKYTFRYFLLGILLVMPITFLWAYLLTNYPIYKVIINHLYYYVFSVIFMSAYILSQKKCGIK